MEHQQDLITLSKIDKVFLQVCAYENLEEFLYKCSLFSAATLNLLVGGADGIDSIYSSMTESKESIETLLRCAEALIQCLTTVSPETVIIPLECTPEYSESNVGGGRVFSKCRRSITVKRNASQILTHSEWAM
ncbi:hypothetical protein CDAR_461471 [Caerostris darwini]|uniref:Uncharacterized protein n=1 Tax=Caerostris darwini TaxID=1538125 RepID=A0AAV4M5K7_9ARAC|nr:hypothetical protein CDAR_461471 [Caerostris darwini]